MNSLIDKRDSLSDSLFIITIQCPVDRAVERFHSTPIVLHVTPAPYPVYLLVSEFLLSAEKSPNYRTPEIVARRRV